MKHLPAAVVEVTRGPLVESRHRVDIVVADAGGALVAVHGEAERPTFPRSAIKALQALALVESGAADRFGFAERHIALACASHNGEAMHVAAAGEMLAAAGLAPRCLECGAQWPALRDDETRLILAGEEPRPIHNNCSGKHAGFLAFAAHMGFPTEGYVGFDHPVQRALAATLSEVTDARHGDDNWGIDGCSIPTWAIPLSKLAIAFARFGAGEDRDPARAKAFRRIRDACFAHPEMVAGTGRACTAIMTALKGRAFVKTGAEGVFVAALPEKALGVALKVEDGATRAAEAALVATLESLLELSPTEARALARFGNPPILNRRDKAVGAVRMAPPG